jgi:hypothetical protein
MFFHVTARKITKRRARRERDWLDLLLRMLQRRRIYPQGIEAQVGVVMIHDRARHLRN